MPIILTFDSVLAKRECDELIALTEARGYEAAPITTYSGFVMRPDIRNNTRVMIDDHARAADLWSRVSARVPSVRRRTPIGLNERFRFYRYDPGQRFKTHTDGFFRRDNGEKSELTFMIFLNDGFEGGETRFPIVDRNIIPKTGMALLFEHELLHEGCAVRKGRKYVLRSDVMYRR